VSDQGRTRTRLRIHFGKRGPLRYTSHLDLARIWERLLRRAGVNVVYSQGFNPRPKMQLAAALPLGYTSTCEILDVWMGGEAPSSLEDLQAHLQANAPRGLILQRIEIVGTRDPALQTLTRAATYHVTFSADVDPEALQQAVGEALESSQIMRERRDKRYDLRPLIEDLAVKAENQGNGPMLVAVLSLGGSATGRPDELLDALGLDARQAHIERVAIHFADSNTD